MMVCLSGRFLYVLVVWALLLCVWQSDLQRRLLVLGESDLAEMKSTICKKYELSNIEAPAKTESPLPQSVPLLLSFPGSGNTWIRLLVEILTGKRTGSLHPDDSLDGIFKAQNKCDKTLSAVKAHPYGILLDRNSSYYTMRYKQLIQRCKLGGIEQFDKTIFIIRDPVVSLWADFHLSLSGNHAGNFQKFPDDRLLKWRDYALEHIKDYQSQWDSLVYPSKIKHPDDMIFIKFENMINSSLRVDEVKKMCNFLHCDPLDLIERIECAFILADVPVVHRKPDVNITNSATLPVNYLSMCFERMPSLSCEIYRGAKSLYANLSYAPFGKKLCVD